MNKSIDYLLDEIVAFVEKHILLYVWHVFKIRLNLDENIFVYVLSFSP